MRIARIACALVLIGCSALAFAHARLVKADPADGSTVKVAPTKFVLTFGEPAKLTALSLQKDAEPAQKIGPLPTGTSAEISVPAPKLAPGKYVLSWRVVGDDGHVLPGQVDVHSWGIACGDVRAWVNGSVMPDIPDALSVAFRAVSFTLLLTRRAYPSSLPRLDI